MYSPYPRTPPRRRQPLQRRNATGSRLPNREVVPVVVAAPHVHDGAREVVAELLDPDPAARLAAGAALDFEFVRGFVA